LLPKAYIIFFIKSKAENQLKFQPRQHSVCAQPSSCCFLGRCRSSS